jgi:hypothetical protein
LLLLGVLLLVLVLLLLLPALVLILLLFFRLGLLLLFWSLVVLPSLVLPSGSRPCDSDKQEQNSRRDKSDALHDCTSLNSGFVLVCFHSFFKSP